MNFSPIHKSFYTVSYCYSYNYDFVLHVNIYTYMVTSKLFILMPHIIMWRCYMPIIMHVKVKICRIIFVYIVNDLTKWYYFLVWGFHIHCISSGLRPLQNNFETEVSWELVFPEPWPPFFLSRFWVAFSQIVLFHVFINRYQTIRGRFHLPRIVKFELVQVLWLWNSPKMDLECASSPFPPFVKLMYWLSSIFLWSHLNDNFYVPSPPQYLTMFLNLIWNS